MKNLIFIALLAVAGYFAYQYFLASPRQDTTYTEPTSYEYLPPIPPECEEQGEMLEDAIYGHEIGKLTVIELNQLTRRFQSCLRDADFTDSQINRTYDEIKESALNTEPDSSRGWSHD